MKAWRIKEPHNVIPEEMDSEPVGESCVKLKLLYSTVSMTDRFIMKGKMTAEFPIIPGREAVGMVVETGENVKNFVRGDIVALKPLSACGSCAKCSEGRFSECANTLIFGINEDGFLRDFAVVCAQDIVKLPERVSAKDAVFLDLIDIAIETVSSLKLEKGQHLVIAGATQLGIILAQVAIYYQTVPILVDIDQSFLETAKQLGVYYTINSSEEDTRKRIFQLTGGKMAEAAAYVVQSVYPFAQITDFVRQGGGIALCGLSRSRPELNSSLLPFVNRKLKLFGISESNKNIASAINMLANKSVELSPFCKREIGFGEVGAELEADIDINKNYYRTIVKL